MLGAERCPPEAGTSFPFLTQLHFHLGGQQRHDDLLEELHRVVVETRLQCKAEILLVPFLSHHGVEVLQGHCAIADAALGSAGRTGDAPSSARADGAQRNV